jgi:hypothetical protein
MLFFFAYIYMKEIKKESMIKLKNILAENMLRFGVKNLSESDKQHLMEGPKAYDPWLELGHVANPQGLKFKSEDAYQKFMWSGTNPYSITAADQKGAPTLFEKDPATNQLKLKVPGTTRNLVAELEVIAQGLFLIAAANGEKNLNRYRQEPGNVNVFYNAKKAAINGIDGASTNRLGTTKIANVRELGTTLTTDKNFTSNISAPGTWSYLVDNKWGPVYTARVAAYAALPPATTAPVKKP